jgi:hypothetical protein
MERKVNYAGLRVADPGMVELPISSPIIWRLHCVESLLYFQNALRSGREASDGRQAVRRC